MDQNSLPYSQFGPGDIIHFDNNHKYYVLTVTAAGWPERVQVLTTGTFEIYDSKETGMWGGYIHAKLISKATMLERAVYENPK